MVLTIALSLPLCEISRVQQRQSYLTLSSARYISWMKGSAATGPEQLNELFAIFWCYSAEKTCAIAGFLDLIAINRYTKGMFRVLGTEVVETQSDKLPASQYCLEQHLISQIGVAAL